MALSDGILYDVAEIKSAIQVDKPLDFKQYC